MLALDTVKTGQNKTFPDFDPADRDDFQPFAHMPVRVKNRPYNEFITNPDYSPFGDFHITAVRVEWVRMVSGDPARLAEIQAYNFESNYDIVVPTGSEVIFEVLMVPFYALLEAPLVDIVGNVWAVPDGGSRVVFDGMLDKIFLSHLHTHHWG